jgi:uncharacterized protein YciI
VGFGRLTIVLLLLRTDAPELDEEASAALRDAHLAHLADLHEAGHLVAAGSLDDEELRGLSIFNVGPEEARELSERDPAVRAGRLAVKVVPWMLPAGAITFSPTVPALDRRWHGATVDQRDAFAAAGSRFWPTTSDTMRSGAGPATHRSRRTLAVRKPASRGSRRSL